MSLTQAEVDALPDGTRVRIKWTGGNGPHEYTTRRNEYGVTMAVVEPGVEDPIDFVFAKVYRGVNGLSDRDHERYSRWQASLKDRPTKPEVSNGEG